MTLDSTVLAFQIVGKYYGKEGQLVGKLQRRYGEAPRIPYLHPPSAAAATADGGSAAVAATARGEGSKPRGGGGAAAPAAARTDLASPHFDALVALTAAAADGPRGLLPEVEAPPLDNLSRCRHLLPPDDAEYVPLGPTDPAAAAAARRGTEFWSC